MRAVVLACGGFEANPKWRACYLGPGWELAKVRGTRFNVGDGLRMALDIGAAPYGNWSGCHATGWDRYAPEFGDKSIGDQFQKHSYIFGLLINAHGKRFVDEGLDFHSFTYAKYGGEVLKQPESYHPSQAVGSLCAMCGSFRFHSLIYLHIMLAFKIAYRRGADRTPHCLALIKNVVISQWSKEFDLHYD
jgi:hypothetical protein